MDNEERFQKMTAWFDDDETDGASKLSNRIRTQEIRASKHDGFGTARGEANE